MIEEAAAELRRAGIGVTDLGLRSPTLDDVFLQLTGTQVSGDGQAPPAADGSAPSPARSAPSPDGTAHPDGAAPAGRSPLHHVAPVSAPSRPARRLRLPSAKAMRSAITDGAVVTVRNLRHFVRQPSLLIFSTIQPVIFVLLFVYVFGGAVSRSLPHGVSYVDFLLPGIFVQSVTFRASQTAVGLSEDLERGVIDRFRSMPMARSAVLSGRTAADLVRNVLIVLLMIVIGYAVGFRFHGGVAGAVACIAVVAAFGLALSWIFAFVALTVHGAEAAQSAGFVVVFPLVFASSVFVPVATFPGWLQAFARISPVTLTANAARSLALTGAPASLAGAAAWIGGLLAVFVPLCVWRYRRMS
jgi:ABC-2 type transport system permease protein/oleandomycin transport system permease protein